MLLVAVVIAFCDVVWYKRHVLPRLRFVRVAGVLIVLFLLAHSVWIALFR